MELKRVDDGEKGFEKVFAFLRDRLLAGSLKPGDRLVSERDLAIQLGVGRPLVREALRALTMLGIVEIRDRIGTVVTRPDVSVLNDFFTFALAQQADMPDDVMQARVAIECQAIRLACERADIADFERLQAALARIAETINESDAGGMADFEFHRTMVLASHSQTLAVLHNSMAGLLNSCASQSPRARAGVPFDEDVSDRRSPAHLRGSRRPRPGPRRCNAAKAFSNRRRVPKARHRRRNRQHHGVAGGKSPNQKTSQQQEDHMKIVVGSDHAGFPMKAEVLAFLKESGHEVLDVGSFDPAPVDFPDIARKVAAAITTGEAERGLMVCGTGVGASIGANKMKGIRAAVCHDVHSAHQCVEHDDVNVMCIGAQIVGPWLAKDLIAAYLGATFSTAEEFRRRVAKLAIMDDER